MTPAGRHPSLAVLRGAGAPAVLAVLVTGLVALVADTSDAAASALVGGAIGVVALAVGPLLHWLCRNLDPAMALGVAVLAYSLVMGVAGVGYARVNDADWLVGGWAGSGLLVAILVWTAGQMRAVTKLRQLLWGADTEGGPPPPGRPPATVRR